MGQSWVGKKVVERGSSILTITPAPRHTADARLTSAGSRERSGAHGSPATQFPQAQRQTSSTQKTLAASRERSGARRFSRSPTRPSKNHGIANSRSTAHLPVALPHASLPGMSKRFPVNNISVSHHLPSWLVQLEERSTRYSCYLPDRLARETFLIRYDLIQNMCTCRINRQGDMNQPLRMETDSKSEFSTLGRSC